MNEVSRVDCIRDAAQSSQQGDGAGSGAFPYAAHDTGLTAEAWWGVAGRGGARRVETTPRRVGHF